jgi:hypothetical protein
MRINEIHNTVKGDFVDNKHYGLCIVEENKFTHDMAWFGMVIRPLTIQGYMNLASDSRCLFNRFLETSKRILLRKVENPEIPKLIFKPADKFEVHEWITLGEVSREGQFSCKFLKDFDTLEEAQKYAELSTN